MQYKILRSKRRSVAIEVALDGSVIVRCPLRYSDKAIGAFVLQHKSWIEKTVDKQLSRSKMLPKEPTKDEQVLLKHRALEYIPQRVKYFENLTGLKATSVKITSAKKRFGSCNNKNGLCFSLRLMLYDKSAVDYVIIHELAHTVHHNHSKKFWQLVEQIMPDYKERIKLLK